MRKGPKNRFRTTIQPAIGGHGAQLFPVGGQECSLITYRQINNT
jgi:hypothetical protein